MRIENRDFEYTNIPTTYSANNTVINEVKAGIAEHSWYITYFNWRISGGNVSNAAGLSIYILDGATRIYQSAISKSASNGASLSAEFANPIKCTMGNSLTLHIDATGTLGTIVTANIGLFQK